MKKKLVLLAAIFISVTIQPISAQYSSVGETKRYFVDEGRSNWLNNGLRPLRVLIWYPANANGENSGSQHATPVIATPAIVPGASIAFNQKKYPLILLAHGAQGNAATMAWQGHYLAARGHIVAALDYNGTPEEERQEGGLTLSEFHFWEYPRDLHIVLNKLLADSVLASRIDTACIGAAGFSLGGYAAISLAGAKLNMKTLQRTTPNLPAEIRTAVKKFTALHKTDSVLQASLQRSEISYKDERIKGIFALAPAVGHGFTREGLRQVDVPVHIVAGQVDVIAPPVTNAHIYAKGIQNAKVTALAGEAGHFTEQTSAEEREEIMQQINSIAADFFEKLFNADVKRPID
jgi:predicted dienelactone hydrolase